MMEIVQLEIVLCIALIVQQLIGIYKVHNVLLLQVAQMVINFS